ncbi:MAG: pitrilysin family protein [Pseudanabaenaceae cyanobacterium SKYGB_i_bin29]|nr:insulinase family protein [Pseudanabaenaceae cyanobacterium SKYG29]MDW8420306.1 pitrilysin family protein [Pseudanabaenaceae cyanobacterium SKYGB_i_bin29]
MIRWAAGVLVLTLAVVGLHYLPGISMMHWRAEASQTQTADVLTDVRKAVLANGLTVLLKPVHSAPVVTVQVWYPVGSRNERPGITGISHQLEHLLFKGTRSRPIQFGRLFNALGSDSNAFTSYDVTAYYGVVGKDKLEALLELEADRMVNALVNEEALQSERTVVLSELDGNNNNPGTRLYRRVMAAAYPNSPYGWMVIGNREDVERFTVADLQQHYRTFYRPDRATLVVVGDVDVEQTLTRIKDIFGQIKLPPAPEPPEYRGNQAVGYPQEPIVVREPGSNPFLQMVFPNLPTLTDPDTAAIDVLDTVLTGGRSSRLYQALVQTGIASNVSGNASTMKTTGWYFFSATPAPGKSLDEVRQGILTEVKRVQEGGITLEELNDAKSQIRANYILSNRNIRGQGFQLGYNQAVAGDYRFSEKYLQLLAQVTVKDVQRVAQRYFQKPIVGYFEPTVVTAGGGGGAPSIQHSGYAPSTPVDPKEVRRYLPAGAFQRSPVTDPRLPEKFILDNGLTFLLLTDRSSPSVTIAGNIRAGTGLDPEEKAGLASLVAQNLRNGTRTADALTLARELERRGASLSFSAAREGVSISGVALREDAPVLLKQLAEVLQKATFPERELELSRQRNLVNLKAELDSPSSLARRTFQQLLYPPGHPFHPMRTAETLAAITRSDVLNFYQQYYRPERTTIVMVGDFDLEATKRQLQMLFREWERGQAADKTELPAVPYPQQLTYKTIPLAGKTQAVTILGHPGIRRTDPRYHPALLLNQVLGGDTLSSRLGTEIRDRQGLTYGIYSQFQAGQKGGTFIVQMQTNPQDVERAIGSTLTLLRQVQREGITASELEAAKNTLINNFPVDLADPSGLAQVILTDEIYGLPRGDFYQFPQRLQNISLAQVNEVARTLLQPDQLLIVTVTPPSP